MELSEHIDENSIISISSDTKEGVLKELVDALVKKMVRLITLKSLSPHCWRERLWAVQVWVSRLRSLTLR